MRILILGYTLYELMKILVLTPYLPYPPSSGGQVRSYNMITKLADRHELTLVCLIKNPDEVQYAQHLKKYCKDIYLCQRPPRPWTLSNIFKSIFGQFPFLVVRNYSSEATTTLRNLLNKEKFDLIHAETFYVLPHLPKTDVPVFLVEQTIEYRVYEHYVHTLPKFIQPFFALDILKLKYWEKHYWKQATLMSTVSEEDKEVMVSDIADLSVEVIPTAAGEDLANLWKNEKKISTPTILLLCNFLWLQNTEAANKLIQDIFPALKKSIPELRCLIAGQHAKEKLNAIYPLGVEIRDIAPSDIQAVLDAVDQSSIMVAPLSGPGGSRLKILGAMAAGVPVVTSKTGIAGIEAKNDIEVIIAKNDSDYIRGILKLFSDPIHYQLIRKNARHLYEKKYSWDNVLIKLEATYHRLAKK